MKEKEAIAKEMEKVESIFNIKHQEFLNVESMNGDLATKLLKLSHDITTLSERREQQEKRTSLLKELEKDIAQEHSVKEQAILSKIEVSLLW